MTINQLIKPILLLTLCSCGTLKKSMVVSAILGSVVGSLGGHIFSPTKEAAAKNTFLFGTLGAAVASGTTYAMYDHPISKKKLKHMLPLKKEEKREAIPLFDFSPELKKMNPKVDFKPVSKFEVPLKKLPPQLKGKVKKQFIIEYESEAKTLKLGNRTFEISPFKAWEHVYEE